MPKATSILKEKRTWLFFILMTTVTTLIYLNHFDNGFHFDDSHTIIDNVNIRNLTNIPSFFIDGTMSSSFPQNQTYRPVVTTTTAIDYWLAGGNKPFFFHLSNFIFFLCQGILIFLFVFKICELSQKSELNFHIAALSTGFYMIHPVMAETVNYIISRSDIQSTFFVLLAFVVYQYSPKAKKYYLYLIPVLLGVLAKPTAIMFAPLLFVYIMLIEDNSSTVKINSSSFFNALKSSLISFLFCGALYVFIKYMLPSTYATGGGELFNYLITQPAVLSYYFGSLFFPIALSADTDWIPFEQLFSMPSFLGFIFLAGFIYTTFICLTKKELKPIAFGLLWFLLALAPTSSLIPLAEVLNDHRMFFPYIGLILALGWAMGQFYLKFKNEYSWKLNDKIIAIVILFGLYGFGTFQRNIVWDNDQSLWKDVTQKSPKNGRGWMNYGLSHMRKGNYDLAEANFNKALKFTPKYHTLHTNLGILNSAKGKINKAEENFKNAISYGSVYYTSFYFYADFLTKQNRHTEAIENLNKSHEIAPTHIPTLNLLMQNYLELNDWDNLKSITKKAKKLEPNNPELIKYEVAAIKKINKLTIEEQLLEKSPNEKALLALCNKYYSKNNYTKAIDVANKVIAINPNSAAAYNNICSINNTIGNFEIAEKACQKAINIDPSFTLAKNNLQSVIGRKKDLESHFSDLKKNPSEANYIKITLALYNYKKTEKAVTYAQEGLTKHPKSLVLYNNITASYNGLQKWEKAIEYAEKGLEIDPNFQLLKNNYNYSLSKIKQ